MRLKLTDLTIQKLPFGLPQKTYHDTLLENFAVRVGLRTKTFIVTLGRDRKRHTIGQYPLTTLQQARDQARDLMLGTQRPDAIAISDVVDEYLRSLQIRPRTSYEYERILKRHLLPVLGSRSLHDISPRDILSITDKLLRTPTECRHAHVAMQTFFNWCVPRYLPVSPMTGLKTPTRPNRRSRTLSYDELHAIWYASHLLSDFGKVVRLCILTGQRRGEIAKIQPAWIQDDTLTIPKEVTKNKREHTIPLTETALALAKQAPFSIGNWGRRKNDLDETAQIYGWVIHDTRRTLCTHLAELQVAPHIIERICNRVTGQGTEVHLIYNRYKYGAELRAALELYEAELRKRSVIC